MRYKIVFILIALWYSTVVLYAQSFQAGIDTAKKLSATTAIAVLDSLASEAKEKNLADTLALIHHTKGVKWYREDLEQAITSTLEAIRIRKSIPDTIGLVQSHFNVARFLDMWGEYYEAVQHFEEVVKLGNGTHNKQFVNACINLGRLERERGDYQRALRFLVLGQSTLEGAPLLSRRDSQALANAYHTTGTIYNDMRLASSPETAVKYFEKAAALYIDLGTQNGLAACYEEWGNALVLGTRYAEAINYFEKAQSIHQEREDILAQAALGNNLSIAYTRQRQFDKAEAILLNSIQQLNQELGTEATAEKASKFDNLAEIYLAQGQYAKALEYFQQAMVNQLPGFKPENITDLPKREMLVKAPDKEDLLVYLSDKIKAWQAYYEATKNTSYLDHALETILHADFLIDLMRAEHLERGSQLFWREKVHSIYESALNICYLLDEQERAFYFLEKSKSILLLEAMVNTDARKVIPDSLARREKALQRQLLQLQRQQEAKPEDQELRQAILANQKESREFIAELKASFPKYHKIRYEHEVASLTACQAALENEQHVLLHYFYGVDFVFIMSIRKEQTSLYRLEKKQALEDDLLAFLQQFQSPSTILNQPQTYAELAHQLYQQLLQPALATFDGQPQKLTLIMDGLLNYLPVEALLYELPNNFTLGQLPYLHKQYQLGYAYSATILLRQQAGTSQASAQLLGLAPFVGNSGANDLPELIYSKAELKNIQQQISGQYLFSTEATSQAFKEQSPLFQIIHLSTHASASDASTPPFIAFADQQLSLPELYAAEIPAELVVLSACETGLGTVQQGEGVMSLARGFTYAGAASLISSLWSVNDQATAHLFTSFYEKLQQGLPKNLALYEAKMSYLQNPAIADEEKSPYYWAGFVFIGADGSVPVKAPVRFWRWGLAVLGIVLGLFLIQRIQSMFRRSKS